MKFDPLAKAFDVLNRISVFRRGMRLAEGRARLKAGKCPNCESNQENACVVCQHTAYAPGPKTPITPTDTLIVKDRWRRMVK